MWVPRRGVKAFALEWGRFLYSRWRVVANLVSVEESSSRIVTFATINSGREAPSKLG
jgi:hypothetical protein